MGALGLSSFLNHNEGSTRKFLKNWKKSGYIVVWLYTRAEIAWASWNHPFIMYGSFKNDKDEEIECLRWPRFVSPDPELVHQNQYFRNEDDTLQVPPALDPFIRLREWLRLECDLPLDTVVFRWDNPHPKTGKSPVIEWRRGHMARLVDRGQANFGSTIDTKLDYFFVVVDDENPADGPQIVRGTKLLGDKMKEEIGQQIQSNGDLGNPLMHPYAIKWIYDNAARSPMDSYKAFRYNQAELTDQIRESIMSSDFPDPSQDCSPRPGDKAKIRAAMEAACQIDLPWDQLFVSGWEDEDLTEFNHGANRASEMDSQVVGSSDGTPGQNSVQNRSESPSCATVPTPGPGPQSRRKKKVDPPAVEMIPCDDCQTPMRVDQAKCTKCGAEYEIDPSPVQPSQVSEPVETRVSNEQLQVPETKPREYCLSKQSSSDDKCWSCGSEVKDSRCVKCGLECSDIPF